jgi:endo-1,4-beta-xylanase
MKGMTFLFSVLVLFAACVQQIAQEDTTDDLAALAGSWQTMIGEPFASFSVPQDSRLTAKQVPVTGKPFIKAWQFTTTSPFETPYVLQLGATNTLAVAKDDVLMVQFWARAVRTSQTAQTEFVLEEGVPTYTKSVTMGVTFGRSWKLFQVPFLAHRNFAVGEASLLFRLGYANQSFELAGVRVVSFGKTRTVGSIRSRGFEYPGIETNAAWRQAANTRIDQLRKGNLTVKVIDASGRAVSGATVKVEMQRHAFPFGSAVDANRLFSDQTYQNNVLKLFNRVVLENDLKWPSWECCNREVGLRALDFFASKGISVRGHNLIWPVDADFILPDDVRGLVRSGNKAAVRQRIEEHFIDILGATKGKIVEWDVINEPSANKFVTDVLGEDELAVWLRRAKELDPNAKLFINDYGNLGEGTLDTEYKRILQKMQTLGAPLEGIGLQAHFAWDLTPPEELHQRLNDFGKLGVPLAITEFDVNVSDETLQANYLRDVLTVAFANPNVTSFLMWGFWEGQHWLPQAALYRLDWSIKPNGKVWNDLIFKQWWTNVTGTSNSSGSYSTRAFLGRYKITATKDGKIISRTVSLPKAGATFTLTLR